MFKNKDHAKDQETHPESYIPLVSNQKCRKCDQPIEIDICNAKKMLLPELRLEKDSHSQEYQVQDWNIYWKYYNNANSYYERGLYLKAREEVNKLKNYNYKSTSLQLLLLRTFRKIIDNLILKKRYCEALSEMQSMFEQCPNVTNTDIRKYNKIIELLPPMDRVPGLSHKDIIVNVPEDEITINSADIRLEGNFKKPKNFKIPSFEETSIYRIREYSNFLPFSLPYIDLNGYCVNDSFDSIPSLKHGTYRFAESARRNAILS